MPPPPLHGNHQHSLAAVHPVHGSDGEMTGHISSSDLLPLVKEEVFTQLFDEAVHDSLSSEGELSDIANRERGRMVLKVNRVPVPTMVRAEPPTSCLLTDWPGEYQFSLSLPPNTRPKDPQYSSLVNKLYICQNNSVTVQLFYTNPTNLVFSLKAVMVFTSPDHSNQSVTVCYQHSHTSSGKLKDPLSPHLMRVSSELVETRYLQFKDTGKHVVLLDPLPTYQGNDLFTPITVKFTDLGSCPGGINRRDTAVVFSLEVQGTTVGRRVLPVRVCTCPKRDREHDEKGGEGSSKAKREFGNPDVATGEKEEQLWVLARGRDNYDALRKVGEVLEKSRGGDVVQWGQEVDRVNKRRRIDN